MNKTTYQHLLEVYGKLPAIWFALFAETTRTLAQRVWVVIIAAQIATNLAAHNFSAAKSHVVEFFIIYSLGAIIGSVGDLVVTRSEEYRYEERMVGFYRKLTGKDMSFYRNNQTGYLVSLYRQYVDSVNLLNRLFRVDVLKMIISLIVPVVVLLLDNVALGLIVFGVVIIQFLYVMWSSSKVNGYRKLAHEAYRKATGEVADHVTNIVAFKSGGMEGKGTTKIQALAHDEVEAFWLRRKVNFALDLPRELVTAGGVALAFFVVLSGASGNPASIGLIMLTLAYMFQVVRTVSDLPNLMSQHDDLVTKLYPTLEYLGKTHETIVDPENPLPFTITQGSLSIKYVGFSYPAQDNSEKTIPVFRDLSITITGGEHVGIVGLSGAGKSTLVNLLMRFDDVSAGVIEIDGIDIRQVRQSELHQKISYVPQEPLLFHSTIRENIAYFNDNATEEDIIQAAQAAHAHDFITGLPNGYNTIVGDRGIKLSGGQKQRVVIARAILKNAPIMIFDEATSALDSESERIIQRALPEIIGQHTAIVIAHRLSTIAGLDRILVMHEGKIVESGTHQELLALGGRYSSLWQKQVTSGDTDESIVAQQINALAGG